MSLPHSLSFLLVPLLALFYIHCFFYTFVVVTYIYVLKYNLLRLYKVMSRYVFRDYQLVLDHQSLCSFLGKTMPSCDVYEP